MQLLKLNHSTFLKSLILKDKAYRKTWQEIRHDLGLEVEVVPKIFDDTCVDRNEMMNYYVFTAILTFWETRLDKIKHYTFAKFFMGFIYRLIYMKAIGDGNEGMTLHRKNFLLKCCGIGTNKRKYLKTVLDDFNNNPISPYYPYYDSDKIAHTWRNYEINENGDRDLLRTMDRAKLCFAIFLESFNIFGLVQAGHMIDFTPLHDVYALKHILKAPLFQPIEGYVATQYPTSLKQTVSFMKGLSDEAEYCDFLNEPLVQSLSFRFFDWTYINIPALQNYFGEKIALYFFFLQSFTKDLFWMAIIGLILFASDFILIQFDQMEYYKYTRMFNATIVVIWSTIFTEKWKSKEKLFSVEYGQEEYEENEPPRPGFNGVFTRNLMDDKMNELYSSSATKLVKVIFGITIALLIACLSVATTLAILYLKEYLENETDLSPFLVGALPGLLNFISMKVYAAIFWNVAISYTSFENHKNISSYEDFLIIKIFIFNILNLLNSFFLLAFVKGSTTEFGVCLAAPSTPEGMECFMELQTQIRSFFLLGFFLGFLEVIIPSLMRLVSKQPKISAEKSYGFGTIDFMIEEELKLAQYQTTMEVDGVLKEYLEVIIQFSFLSFFGIVFPASFAIAYLTMISQIGMDKYKLLNFYRRPTPKGAKDIGTWTYVLDIISFFTIFVNAGIIVYNLNAFDPIIEKLHDMTTDEFDELLFKIRLRWFAASVVFLLAIKQFIQMLIPDVSPKLENLLKRLDHIKKKTSSLKGNNKPLMKGGIPLNMRPDELDVAVNYDKDMKDAINMMKDENVVARKKNKEIEESALAYGTPNMPKQPGLISDD